MSDEKVHKLASPEFFDRLLKEHLGEADAVTEHLRAREMKGIVFEEYRLDPGKDYLNDDALQFVVTVTEDEARRRRTVAKANLERAIKAVYDEQRLKEPKKRLDVTAEHLNVGALRGKPFFESHLEESTVPCPNIETHALYQTCPLCRGKDVVPKG